MPASETFELLGIALALGLLVGMQRERVEAPLAGMRTFALITVLGTMCGLMAQTLGGWIIVAGILGVSAVIVAGNIISMRAEVHDAGVTTEIAMLVMFALGAFLVFGPRETAVAVGGGTAVLLHAKGYLQAMLRRLGDADFRGIMQVALVSLVILPVLPNEPFGPFQVLNLRQIWWMVVLVSAISLGGYLALKFLGQRAGLAVSGLLGGLISSTATTVSSARRASHSKAQVNVSTMIIMLASAVVYARVLTEVAVVAPGQFWGIAQPILVMMGVALGAAALAWWWSATQRTELSATESPTETKSAILFGAMYAVVLLAVAAAEHFFGDRGIYVVAGISGLTDMDAITMSTSRMSATGAIQSSVAWRAIVVATIANMVFKTCIVGVLGSRALFIRIVGFYALSVVTGLALLVLWK